MTPTENDQRLLDQTSRIVEQAGQCLLARFGTTPPPVSLPQLLTGIEANDAAVGSMLRDALLAARPGSQWTADEEEEGALPPGEWWVVDPAEGNINLLHGRSGWGVTATLVRNGETVLTAINVPLMGETYTALSGKGAFVNSRPLRVSAKNTLGASIVSSGQASPGESKATRTKMIRSAEALLDKALLVRLSVPSTLELVDVAAGRLDAFWQHGSVRAGLLGGALLVREAGGIVTDLTGVHWGAASADFLACPPTLHPAMLDVLSSHSEHHP